MTLGPDDFQRIGLQPRETRLDVIRRAASKATKSLATRQLSSPNALTEQQLSRIALSTYRLLDPRQRSDRQSRAHVGRIRPGALYRAGRTEFADGKILIQSCEPSESSVPTHHINGMHAPVLATAGVNICSTPPPVNRPVGVVARLRRQATRPGLILAMIAVLLLTAGGIWNWGQSLQTWRGRLAPASSGP